MPENKNKKRTEQKQKKRNLLRTFGLEFNLSKEKVMSMFVFILFLAFWAVIFIANRHYAESTEREISHLENEVKDLRADYLTTKQSLMFETKQSEIANRVRILGLKELKSPPKKIELSD